MRYSRYYLALGAVLIGTALWVTWQRSHQSPAPCANDASEGRTERPRGDGSHEQETAATASTATTPNASAQLSEQRHAMPPPLTDAERLAKQQKAFDAIEAAAITYDAKSLPLIEPFLSDPDRLVRDAAVQGMIANGDASAANYLRAAAAKTPDPREAAAMLDAADYVELPSASLIRKQPAHSHQPNADQPRPNQANSPQP